MLPSFTTSKPPTIPQSLVADNAYSRVLKTGKLETFSVSSKVAGSTTLVAGTKNVTVPGIESTDLVFVTMGTHAGTAGIHYEPVFVAAVGTTPAYITINSIAADGSLVNTDTSTVNYLVVKTVA